MFHASQELNANGSKAAFLAGPLGFEPRQSAPKALDLPLVDGPVIKNYVDLAGDPSLCLGISAAGSDAR